MKLTKTTHFDKDKGLIEVPMTLEEYQEACAHHYRQGAEFFGLFLDEMYMGYSCGVFENEDDTLEEAMENKYDIFTGMLSGCDKVLEVGSGFGGLSRDLADWNLTVDAYNISKTQHDYCEDRNTYKGKSIYPKLHYHNKCWTEITGAYDAIVSDEFIVHTGGCRLDFFKKMRSVIKDGGTFALKNLSTNHTMNGCQDRANMANIKIFGGNGTYPTYFETLRDADEAGFARESSISIPIENYMKTSAAWKTRLLENADKLKEIDEELFHDCHRMFRLYDIMFRQGFLTVEMTKFVAV